MENPACVMRLTLTQPTHEHKVLGFAEKKTDSPYMSFHVVL